VKKLPLTPLHYLIAYLIHKCDERLSLPGLVVGCMQPDVETPIIFFLTRDSVHSRLILHSLTGAATLGTMLSLVLTALIYPRLISRLFSFSVNDVKMKCRISYQLVLSCFLGNLSHVLLDLVNHEYNPLFWPFLPAENTFNPICPLLGGYNSAGLIVGTFMLIITASIIVYLHKHHDFHTLGFWKRILVG